MRTKARRWGAGTSSIVRALIAAAGPVSQTDLAKLVGVSQPRVSQVLSRLSELGAVSHTPDGYLGAAAELLGLYRTQHSPALATPERPWYGLQPMTEQVDQIRDRADKALVRIAVSADLGPDLIAPWRHPTLTVVYTDEPLDLAGAGFVPAEGRVDASILIRHTTDSTLLAAFEPWPRTVQGVPLTDPVQQVWDLDDLGGADRTEAADRLAASIIARTLVAAG